MSRIPTASRESVPQDQVDSFDTLVASRGSVPDIGPVAIMINSPELATRGEHFRAYFRGDEITLEASVRELAIILTPVSWTASSSGTPTPVLPAQQACQTNWLTTSATRKN